MDRKLSIIIPVYNGARFIGACLTSLINQLVDDVELILVNDGSTDATHEIISSALESLNKTGQFIYLSTENRGVSAARNSGLDAATGDYIAFVDADDLVSPEYITKILAACADSPSIIEFGYRTIDQAGDLINSRCHIHTKFGRYNRDQVLNNVFASCLWYSWVRVFKRDLFDGVRFPPGVRYCEDLIAITAVYRKANTILALADALYDYRLNPAGATLNIKAADAGPLIEYYRQIKVAPGFANKALKINLAYAMRRCLAQAPDLFGCLPVDIEADVLTLVWTPALFLSLRRQLVIYAIWGARLNFVKRRKFGIFSRKN